MTTIKESAEEFKPKQTLNIADLKKVSVDLELQNETDVEFPYQYVMIDGEKYRVPISVIKTLNAILEHKQDLKYFKVNKKGEGMNTEYTVIPLE